MGRVCTGCPRDRGSYKLVSSSNNRRIGDLLPFLGRLRLRGLLRRQPLARLPKLNKWGPKNWAEASSQAEAKPSQTEPNRPSQTEPKPSQVKTLNPIMWPPGWPPTA